MANLTTHQLAEILLGVARAQQAIIDAMENSKAGFKSTHFRPMLETASRIRSNRAETLSDFPPRLLLHMLGRNAPAVDNIARELDELLAREPQPSAAAAPGARIGGKDPLDMT
jgi:hypothetical protein